MADIKWQDEYSVGVKELDEQHKRLLDIFNKVIYEQEEKYDEEKFSSSLTQLIHYAYTHFAAEERYLQEADFPDLKNHVMEHIDFIRRTLNLALKIDEGGDESRKGLLRYLQNWYSMHVLGLDRCYIPYLKALKDKQTV
jgi:hemerythrin-like metal-binding protein